MPPVPAVRLDRCYTWADYLSWPEGERWEIIQGVAYGMSAAPSTRHQDVCGKIYSRLEQQLRGHPCRPFVAPTAVKLSDINVVEPDILVVCDRSTVTASHIEGAPDLIVEVLSPGTSAKDLRQKKALYEQSGVREYVVVDPLEHYAIRFLLGADGYDKGSVFASDEVLTFATLEGVEVPLWEVFDLPGPGPADRIAG